MKTRLNIISITILSLLLTITLLPVSIHADETAEPNKPDVSVYATKEQMMDDTFATNSEGENIGQPKYNNIGIIEFGKKENESPQKWYVLGRDDGIKDEQGKVMDNTVIFAYDCISDTPFGEVIDYSQSRVRKLMNDFVNNNQYFSSIENSLLNETPISNDINDKLYLLYAEESGKDIIKAGSSNQINLNRNNYWNNGFNFWLRPYNSTVMHAKVSLGTSNEFYLGDAGVRPASNLNLTKVLFASAAKANESGKIADGAAMTLRLDGSDKNIGDISYDENNIYVITPGERILFVQGRNGDQNWVYRFDISAYGVLTKGDILDGLKTARNPITLTDIDLSKCKIWIEDKGSDGLIYAVEAKKAISSVDISIDPPVAGKPLATNAECNTTGIDSTMPLITWDTTDETAIYSKTYKAYITLTPKDGHVFVNMNNVGVLIKTSVNVSVNPATDIDTTVNNDGTLTVSFELAAKDNILDIEQPALTYENGTPIDEFKLPDKVKVTGYSGKEYQLAIFPWEAHPDNNYDPECKDEQTLVYYSGLKDEDIPGELNYSNPDGPDVKLTITIKAAKTSNNTGGNHTVIIPDTSVK